MLMLVRWSWCCCCCNWRCSCLCCCYRYDWCSQSSCCCNGRHLYHCCHSCCCCCWCLMTKCLPFLCQVSAASQPWKFPRSKSRHPEGLSATMADADDERRLRAVAPARERHRHNIDQVKWNCHADTFSIKILEDTRNLSFKIRHFLLFTNYL